MRQFLVFLFAAFNSCIVLLLLLLRNGNGLVDARTSCSPGWIGGAAAGRRTTRSRRRNYPFRRDHDPHGITQRRIRSTTSTTTTTTSSASRQGSFSMIPTIRNTAHYDRRRMVALHPLVGGVSSRVRNRRRCNLSAAATISGNFQMEDASNTTNNTAVTGVTLKVAVDAQGGAADLSNNNTKQERFTCSTSLDRVHRLRAVSDAVLVGKGTVQADNPSLLVRRNISYATQPLRVVIDPTLELLTQQDEEGQYQIFTDGYPTVVYHCQKDVDDTLLDLDERCVTLVYMEPTKVENHTHGNHKEKRSSTLLSPRAIVQHLRHHFDVEHLMVEGGPVTARQFLQEDGTSIVDRCLIVRAVTVEFPQPLPSGLTDEYLSEQCGLQCLGRYASGVDEITCWTRPNLCWPTSRLEDWP